MSSRFLMHSVFPPSKPPDGGYSPSFRLVVGGTQLRGSWYLSAIVRLQGFSSASPAAPLRRRSPETVTTAPGWGEASRAAILVPPSASRMFIILAGVGAGLSRSSTSRAGSWVGLSFGVRGRGRSLALRAGRTSTTWGWSTARRVHGGTVQDIARCQGGVRVLGRYCLCTGTVPPRGGRCPTRLGGSEWGSAGRPGSLYVSSPPERRRGRGQDCSSIRPKALAAAIWPPGAGVVVVAAGASDGEPPVVLRLLRSPPPIEWGCSYLRRWNRSSVCNGTSNASVFVHCGCRGLNMYVVSARSRVFSSFSSTKARLLVV
jgi:hypothetical protein